MEKKKRRRREKKEERVRTLDNIGMRAKKRRREQRITEPLIFLPLPGGKMVAKILISQSSHDSFGVPERTLLARVSQGGSWLDEYTIWGSSISGSQIFGV